MNDPQKKAVRLAIQEARAPIAASQVGITAIAIPAIRQIIAPKGGSVKFTTADCPLLKPDADGRVDGSQGYTLPLDPSLEFIQNNPMRYFTLLNFSIRSAILYVGDVFQQFDYFDKRPEYEFLRHVRNAVAHGNRFNIKSVKRRSAFKTYEIRQTLHGTRLFRDQEGIGYLHEGDALALLDHLENQATQS